MLLKRLHEFARSKSCYDYGLPIYDDGTMAQMREIDVTAWRPSSRAKDAP